MARNNSLTAAYAAVQAAFWMSVCTSASFAAVYLQGLGYNNTQLGVILAAGNLLGALLGPAVSARIDAGGGLTAASAIPPLLAAQAAALLALLLFPVRGAAASIAFVLYIAFCLAVNSPVLKLYVDAAHGGEQINFGVARATGSLAYVLISALLGVVIERTSVRVLPIAGLSLCAVQFAFCARLRRGMPDPPEPQSGAARGSSITGFARKNPRFCVLLLGMAFLFFAHNTVGNFFINIAQNVGGGTSTMGWLNAFMAAVEIPVMLSFARLRRGQRLSSLLRLSFGCFTLKTLAVALAGSVPALFASLLLQMPSFAVYAAAIVDYTDEAVAFEDSAKAQSLVYSMTTLGSVLASIVSGRLFDVAGVTPTLFAACAVCAAGTFVAWAGLQKTAR